jgi:hypothetical protein
VKEHPGDELTTFPHSGHVDCMCRPGVSDSALYTVVFENQRVRMLRYRDRPGDKTTLHEHPDMVLVPLSNFRRRLTVNGHTVQFREDRV